MILDMVRKECNARLFLLREGDRPLVDWKNRVMYLLPYNSPGEEYARISEAAHEVGHLLQEYSFLRALYILFPWAGVCYLVEADATRRGFKWLEENGVEVTPIMRDYLARKLALYKTW